MPRLRNSMLRMLMLLVIAGTAWADLSVVGDKLTLDALVWTGAYWWRFEHAGFAQNKSAFERAKVLAGLTGYLSPVVSFRMSGDVSYLQPQDLHVDLHWSSGFGLRAGQFLLPLGMDAMTEPDSERLSGSSLLVNYAKPTGTRDIGILGSWAITRLSVSAAVVNGAGANSVDNNDRKDFCGRAVIRPLSVLDGILAVRVYYGWPDASDSVWRTAAAEARLRSGPLELQAEFQNNHGVESRNNAAYLQAAWDIGVLEAAGRFDLVMPQGKRVDWMATAGLNARPVSDHFKVMLSCSYRRDYQGNWSFFGFLLRLQAGL